MAEFSNSPGSTEGIKKEGFSTADTRQPEQSAAGQTGGKSKQNWLQRWWKDGLDKRGTLRESVPGIVAFFFSGGPPKAHELGNISVSGTFVYTDEHWHRGTIVRMTITDQREIADPKSITVNAMVNRSNSEGVGFQFIFVEEKKQRRSDPPADPGPLVNVTKTQFRDFLKSVKAAA